MYYIPKGSKPAPQPPQHPPPEPIDPGEMPPPEEPPRPPPNEPETPPEDPTPESPEPGEPTRPEEEEEEKPQPGTPENNPPQQEDDDSPDPDSEPEEDEEPPKETPPAKTCTGSELVLARKGLAQKAKATVPNKVAWYTVVPEATNSFTLAFDLNAWGTLKETKGNYKEAAQKFKDYRANKKAAAEKWKKEAEIKAQNMLSVKITVLDTKPTDFAEIDITSKTKCDFEVPSHKLSSKSAGESENTGLTPGATPGTWKLKAKGPKKKDKTAEPKIYEVRLPECEPSTKALVSKVCVFPTTQQTIEILFQPKSLNEISQKIAKTLSIFGDRLKFDVEIGTFFLAGVEGWFQQSDGTMTFERELQGGAKPLIKVEVTLKISVLECISGIPKECWEYIADIGAFFTLGGSLEILGAYTNRYLYSTKKTQHEVRGDVVGKLYAKLGLYAKAGPKDIAEVSVEAGAQFGITGKGQLKATSGDKLGLSTSLDVDPVKLFVTIKTKYLWVFSSEHPTEWKLTNEVNLLKKEWTLMDFNATKPAA